MTIERISQMEREFIDDVLINNFRSSSGGKYMKLLEEEFSKKFNKKYGISFVNGTATMHACLEAWGIGEGDEVIITPLTMSSTTFCVLQANATPVYADVDKQTFNIDPDSIKKKITKNTKAIIPVSLFGLSPDMEEIMNIAHENEIKVLEDNAECFLGKYKNKLVGEYGDAASYSFQSSKHLTSGEGGMVITDDEDFANNLRKVQSLGYASLSTKTAKISKDEIQDPSYFRHSSLGWNYRMPELCCAVALAQVRRIEELVDIRKQVGELFNQATQEFKKYLTPQAVPESYENSYWTWAAVIYDETIYKEFREEFIESGGDRFYGAWKLGYQEPFLKNKNLLGREKYLTNNNYNDGICPVAEDLQKRLMCFKTNYWDLAKAKKQAEILNAVCRRIFN